MIHKFLYLLLFFLCCTSLVNAQQKTIWSIGDADNSHSEFALAPSGYQDFLKNDFGWEDKFFVVGFSEVKTDFPYVLPGTTDYWGGTSTLSGIRPHEINILFNLDKSDQAEDWQLLIDILDCSPENPPLVKITVNDTSWKHQLSPGVNEEGYKGEIKNGKEQLISVFIPTEVMRQGGNEIEITTLQGSWLVFDQVRLEGPEKSKWLEVEDAFLRNVKAADYALDVNGKSFQPLLVDVEHLQNTPQLTVYLDQEVILEKTIEQGRYEFEAPMPALKSSRESTYRIALDGKTLAEGIVQRGSQQTNRLSDYVDTKIGTGHSRWMIAPGPWMPFSMVKISPDNQEGGWQAGYQPTFESVGTFSHIHEWTMAGLGTFPTHGPLVTDMGSPEEPESGYRSSVDKSSEQTPLGYYSVLLSDYDIKAELTATTRASFQRYTYPQEAEDARILIDLQIPAEYGYKILEAHLKQVGDNKIVGYSKQITERVWGERHYREKFVKGGDKPAIWDDITQEYIVHFVMEFDQPISRFGVVVDGEAEGKDLQTYDQPDQLTVQNPEDVVAYVEFETQQNQVVQTRTGISYVSIDNAALNLREEISQPFGWNFEAVRQHQEDVWNELFDRVVIHTDDRREKSRFYSNMYRALVSRNIFSDVDGSWIDAEENRQQLTDPNSVALGCDAFWNTFWNLNQFWNLVTPEWSSKWVKSQLAMYDAHGWLAKGPAGMEYIPVMVAEHEISLIVGAYQMGIRDFDAEKSLEAVYKMQTNQGEAVGGGYAGNRDLKAYMEYKYVPYNKGRFSNTLEYSFDDYAVSQLAKSLGNEKIYQEFIDRGYWWKNAIDTTSGFARLKHSDGRWYEDFDPIQTGGNYQYVEGNAWQLTFFVPQDVPALANLVGQEKLAERLKSGFSESSSWRYNAPNDLYWEIPVTQGNQQSMHFAYLFNWVKHPWLTQKWSRDIIDKYYGFGISNAYLGDEDQGQMSAWFMMSALGLFQTDGGTSAEPIYEIGSPLFEKTVIDLGRRYNRGESFTIEARNASRTNKYVQSARLNGKPLENFWFPASELLKGGQLELEMGSAPNENWGIKSIPSSKNFDTK